MIRGFLKICRRCAAGVLGIVFALGAMVGAILRSIPRTFAPVLEHRVMPSIPSPSAAKPSRKRRALRALLLIALVALVLGSLVIASGIIPIKASSRHWPITEWFLHTTMRRSISTHSRGIDPPPLDHPDLVLKGATHYEIGCRSCHGSPGMRQPRIPLQMTPHPPALPEKIRELKPRELFYVVKHGVKFTGMPAWPALQRDDEVWAVVAFLQKLPDLDEAGYHRLIHGEPPATAPMEVLGVSSHSAQAIMQSCARCHGRDGIGRGGGAFPNLAGQRSEYFENALIAYASGERHSGIMAPIAAGLSDDTVRELARYYSGLQARAPQRNADPAAIERGKAIAQNGIAQQRVPSCVDCHAQEGPRHKSAYPALAGQPADYLVLQLDLFKSGHRGGSRYAHLMNPVASRLKPEQARDVALYFESLPLPASAPRREHERQP